MGRTERRRRRDREIDRRLRIEPGAAPKLRTRDCAWAGRGDLARLGDDELRDRARETIARNLEELAEAQELLWANDSRSMLLVFQALDAAGKDGTIKHVMTGVNPAGCRVVSFKQPTSHELDHNWLWRYWLAVPERGQICIFNRSHYEDVLVVRVHPELLEQSRIPAGKRGGKFWRRRYEDINAFERHLADNGTIIRKFFLHVSREEQRRRFLERIDDAEKQWKFSAADVRERAHWDDYIDAYEEAIAATSTAWAPWYVVPADHKWLMRAIVARVVTRAVTDLGLRPPVLSAEARRALDEARVRLLAE